MVGSIFLGLLNLIISMYCTLNENLTSLSMVVVENGIQYFITIVKLSGSLRGKV